MHSNIDGNNECGGNTACLVLQAVTVALGAWLVSKGASPLQRSWIGPSLVFSLAFIDSSIQGLCTESWVSCL